MAGFIFGLIFVGIILITSAVKVVMEYERGVIFRLGRLVGVKGPGLFFIIPFGIDKMIRVSLRTLTMDVPAQEVITKDNVPAKVNAVAYFRVMDPAKAIVEVQNYIMATSQLAQTTLRSVVGQAELDEILAEREKINTKLQHILDESTDPWGIKVSMVEVKDVQIPDQMQRAIAQQAEAERERRAKIIMADAEFQAADKIRQAGEILAHNPVAIQLRYLQTFTEVTSEKNTTTIFPLPIELMKAFLEKK